MVDQEPLPCKKLFLAVNFHKWRRQFKNHFVTRKQIEGQLGRPHGAILPCLSCGGVAVHDQHFVSMI